MGHLVDSSWRFLGIEMFEPILTLVTCFTFLAAIAFCIIRCRFFGPPSIASRWVFTLNHQKPPFFWGVATEPGPPALGPPLCLVCLSNLWIASSACILQQDQLRSRSSGAEMGHFSGLPWDTTLKPWENHDKPISTSKVRVPWIKCLGVWLEKLIFWGYGHPVWRHILEPDPQVEWTRDFAAIQVCLKISCPIPSHGVNPHFPHETCRKGVIFRDIRWAIYTDHRMAHPGKKNTVSTRSTRPHFRSWFQWADLLGRSPARKVKPSSAEMAEVQGWLPWFKFM